MGKLDKLCVLCLASILILSDFGSDSAHAKMKEYSFVNYSERAIRSLYITPSSYDKWGKDLLKGTVLKNGDSYTIRYSDTIRYFDIKVVWTDGSNVTWTEYDYSSIWRLTLFRNVFQYYLRKN